MSVRWKFIVRTEELVRFGIRWVCVKFEYEELDGVRAEAARIAANKEDPRG